jgi:hypothetical protein
LAVAALAAAEQEAAVRSIRAKVTNFLAFLASSSSATVAWRRNSGQTSIAEGMIASLKALHKEVASIERKHQEV